MNVIEDYKPINFTYYNPRTSLFKAGKSDRERTTVYFCNNVESCDAYKRGKCVMLNGLYSHSCPYGKIERQEGYTKAARSCGVLISKMKDKYGDVEYSKKNLGFVCYIGDYVYLNLPHLINYSNSIRDRKFFIDEDIIKKEDFTPEFVVELIKYRPEALMGGEIKSYQKDNVPKFCTQLKRYMPDMYEKVKAIYPEIEERTENINYVGKRAKLMTLLAGKVKVSTNVLDWDGKVLHAKGNQISFWKMNDEEVTIIPNKDTIVDIYDNATVTDDTELVDE